MDNDRAFSGRALRVSAVGLLALAGPALAHAEGRPVTLDFEQTSEYGRILVSWADSNEDAPRVSARMTGPVLVLSFEDPVSFDPEELAEGLPQHIAVARLTDDGTEARIALSREYTVHQSYSFDLAGIDLVDPLFTDDPPDVVSPLAAQREREAEEARAAAEAAL